MSTTDRNAQAGVSATTGRVGVINLTPEEQEILRTEAWGAIQSPADNLDCMAAGMYRDPEGGGRTAADVLEELPRLDTAVRMLRGVEAGELPCEPGIIKEIREGLAETEREIAEATGTLDAYARAGVEGYLEAVTDREDSREYLRSKMTLGDLLEELGSYRDLLPRKRREVELFNGVLARAEETNR